MTIDNQIIDEKLYECRKLVINAIKSGLFQLKSTTGTRFKILTPKQSLQRLPIKDYFKEYRHK